MSIYDIQPQMWTYEKTVKAAARRTARSCRFPGHCTRTSIARTTGDPPARHRVGGQAREPRRALKKEELGDALRYPEGGPTAPAKAAAKIEVHPEFNLTLVAAEPLIAKAMNIDWDEKGRLWVAETPEYPNGRRVPEHATPWKDTRLAQARNTARDPEDTISILSDTNGDGVMDKKHVFADKLELVTGFVFYKNGVIVVDVAGHLVSRGHQRRRGRGQAHEALHRPRHVRHARRHQQPALGLDGWIYATHGYSVGDVTSPDGTKDFGRDGSGVVRFKPDGSAFEQYQQPRRQHLGPRHHLGRPGVLDAADERHGLLPHRAARVGARQGHGSPARRRGRG